MALPAAWFVNGKKAKRRSQHLEGASDEENEHFTATDSRIWLLAGGVLLIYFHTFFDTGFWKFVLSLVTLGYSYIVLRFWRIFRETRGSD